MQVKVKLFATLRDYLPKDSDGRSCQINIDEATTIEQIIATVQHTGGNSKNNTGQWTQWHIGPDSERRG